MISPEISRDIVPAAVGGYIRDKTCHIIILEDISFGVGVGPGAIEYDQPNTLIGAGKGQDQVKHFLFGAHGMIIQQTGRLD